MATDETAVDCVECPAVELTEQTPMAGRMPPSIHIDDTCLPLLKRRVLITDKHGPAFFDAAAWHLITATHQDRVRPTHNRTRLDIQLSPTWLCISDLFVAWWTGVLDDDLEDDNNSNDDKGFGWWEVLINLMMCRFGCPQWAACWHQWQGSTKKSAVDPCCKKRLPSCPHDWRST
jgi:hypothetical protein